MNKWRLIRGISTFFRVEPTLVYCQLFGTLCVGDFVVDWCFLSRKIH